MRKEPKAMQQLRSKAEERAVERHRQALSEKAGHEVSFKDALADWLKNCACAWREGRQAKMLARQREEILRYKWIESEKAQRDVGKQPVVDWIRKYAAQWRAWYEANEDYE